MEKPSKGLARTNKHLSERWRSLKILSALFGVLAIVPTGIDYELNYSPDRSFDHCSHHTRLDYAFRYITVLCSLTALILLYPSRYYYLQYRRFEINLYSEIPALHRMTIDELVKKFGRIKLIDYLDREIITATILYLIMPYPYMDVKVYVPQVMEGNEMCYYLSEIFYAFMYFRIPLLILFLFSYSKYQSHTGFRHCEKYGLKPRTSLSLRYILNEKPLLILCVVFIIPSIFVFGSMVRIFETPAHPPGGSNDLQYYQNCFWLVFISMSTVGYGDLYPITMFGRITMALAIIVGGIILSMMFATVALFLYLNENQKKAYGSIIISRDASRAITDLLEYNANPSSNIVQEINSWDKVRQAAHKFKETKNKNDVDMYAPSEEIKGMSKKVDSLENNIRQIRKALEEIAGKRKK